MIEEKHRMISTLSFDNDYKKTFNDHGRSKYGRNNFK